MAAAAFEYEARSKPEPLSIRSLPPNPSSVSLPSAPLMSSSLSVPISVLSLLSPATSDATETVLSANCSASMFVTRAESTFDLRVNV